MPDYFTLAELRAKPDMSDIERFSNEECEAAAGYIVGIIEREVGTSFILRHYVDEPHDGGVDTLVLDESFVRSVTSATEDGVDVTDVLQVRGDVVHRLRGGAPVPWAWGYSNVLVTYVAGYSSGVPGDVKEAALKGTRAHLLANAQDVGLNDRRTSMSTEQGVINFVVAGEDRPSGYPEVDAMILGWKKRIDVLGFA